ncbi:glycine-rich RNA-binding protein 2, mitochondrial-like [Diospyros lotus]|uniref:glycine-rich RNA-binding protein 2, mitochondrial-like n=1 Tax=Diospyros lotus TaxID=55363 RepID=UPI002259AC51|nr:glycine-rich RNA-binding protein 2, mitochondrial-like [Diospyros lotus]XP_052176955.1 glycine-rich RNA-binding protein 2, mitochondrial-like [Diospyros lotus]XP_052176956.1 glycine-rich RNA-binding protein 2, mitochondrial-like [Diospyros lotus]XP_052176957.1 glycine-rich RNA-binding protein 2, mitochondrial-like [Diospyros lotus]
MSFLSKTGSMLRQTVSKHIKSEIYGSNPFVFQMIRCMSSSKLFIGGLSYGTDETSLREAFNKYGDVVEAKVIIDRDSGRSRGFGFVTYTNGEEASAAIQALDGQDLHGRRVRVNYANDRPQTGGFGGGYGAGSYGSGGYGGVGSYGGANSGSYGSGEGYGGSSYGGGGYGSGGSGDGYGGNYGQGGSYPNSGHSRNFGHVGVAGGGGGSDIYGGSRDGGVENSSFTSSGYGVSSTGGGLGGYSPESSSSSSSQMVDGSDPVEGDYNADDDGDDYASRRA